MSLVGRDLFELWRLALGLTCTVYATVVTVRSLGGWVAYFSGKDRTTVLLRHYVLAQLVSLRLGRFRDELLRIAFWLAALVVLLRLHVS
ncbi:MAG: hypothetical protein DCC65_18230 [Planctomycetota bacterium]|nr:MAG: hypothetical protein DCC65_18230 [Planctomycetota bacterium]